MSTLNVNTINPVQANEPLNFQTGGTTFVQLTTAGVLSGVGGTLTVAGTVSAGIVSATNTAKAWVTWNGTTDAIFLAYNVSSVTSSSTGIYEVNFTTSMSNADICVVGSVLASTKGVVACNDVTADTVDVNTREASTETYTDYGRVGIVVYCN